MIESVQNALNTDAVIKAGLAVGERLDHIHEFIANAQSDAPDSAMLERAALSFVGYAGQAIVHGDISFQEAVTVVDDAIRTAHKLAGRMWKPAYPSSHGWADFAADFQRYVAMVASCADQECWPAAVRILQETDVMLDEVEANYFNNKEHWLAAIVSLIR